MQIIINQPRASYYIGGAEMISFQHAKFFSYKDIVTFISVSPRSICKNYSKQYLDFKKKYKDRILFIELDMPKKYSYIYDIAEGFNRFRWNWESIIYNRLLNLFVNSRYEKSVIDVIFSYYILDSIIINKKIIKNNCLYLCGTPKKEDDFQGSFLISYDKTIAISGNTKDYWQKYSKTEIPVIPTGVDSSRFKFTHKDSVSTSKVVLYIGRMLKRKGVYLFAEVARKIIETGSINIKFQMVGDSPELSHLKSNYGDIIDFTGSVDNPEYFIGSSDVVVLPSLYGEGIPGVILESMSCGKPVIASNTHVNRELLGDNRGVVVEELSKEKILEAILNVLYGNIRIAGSRSRKYIVDNYNWSDIANQLRKELLA